MKEKESSSIITRQIKDNKDKYDIGGYPSYPPGDDIYGKLLKDSKINPENPDKMKDPFDKNKSGSNNEKDFDDDVTGNDLDIPGSELDDELELIGSEDEENNYYSLGGDDHNDLDEDNIELNP